MKFPQVSDIATTSVTLLGKNSLLSEALELMLKENHRNAIVCDGDVYRILTVIDILNARKDDQEFDIELYKLNLRKVPTIKKYKNVLDTIEYLSNSIEHICVLNTDNSFFGIVTHTDITTNIDPETLMDNYRLVDFLKYGRRMKWVSKDIITSELLEDMIAGAFDNVVIIEDMKPKGILTTKDIMKLIKDQNDLSLPVYNYMSSPVDTIHKNASIKEALSFVNKKKYKRAVVVDDNGQLSGIISQKELISLTYSRWALFMKEYQEELSEINTYLKNQNREFETLASTDSLTGLYNRNKFSELYVSSYKSMVQRHNKMSIIFLDIDHFKQINDKYGHNVGDQVIIQISHTLLRTLRNIDIVCRWGGEEFVALLPTAGLEIAKNIANKIREYIHQLDIDLLKDVTASFGITEVKEGDNMEDVIQRADKALYLAKNSGRNCVKTTDDLNL
jgi:diguanylate cyclase (GGDEF)-like protein